MRDPELMITLLKEMSQSHLGSTMAYMTLGASEERQQRHHHANLLVDAGHAEWMSQKKEMVRITNQGYDFLNAVDKQSEAKALFVDLFNKGLEYAEAARRAIELVRNLFGDSSSPAS